MVPSDTKNQSDQNKTFRDVLRGLWVLGRMFGHEFHALLIFQEFLIADDFAALFGFFTPHANIHTRMQTHTLARQHKNIQGRKFEKARGRRRSNGFKV